MHRIKVPLRGRAYPLFVQKGALKVLGRLLEGRGLCGCALVVTQPEIWSKWGAAVSAALGASGIAWRVHLPASRGRSEKMKSVKELLRLVGRCASLDGKGAPLFILAVGGGVVGDVGGFAASIYRRGIPLVHVPTTLTAQVDSAIGGKTAVDLPQGKNLLGTVYQPRLVLIDPGFLETLPTEMLRDGMAEVVKTAAIRDQGLFRFLEKRSARLLDRSPAPLEKIIRACARIKADIVARDEFDRKGIRMVLNFGHTVGHALEAASGFTGVTHGQAVSIGMTCAAGISNGLGVLKDPSVPARLERLLRAFGLPIRWKRGIRVEKIMTALGYDKKNSGGTNRFVLLERLGKPVIHRAVPDRLIYDEIMKRRE